MEKTPHERVAKAFETSINIVQQKLKMIDFEKGTPYESEFTNISKQELQTILSTLEWGKAFNSLIY